MSAETRRRLSAAFREEPLDFKQTVFEQGKPIEDVYFVESGVISIVTALAGDEGIETGTVGNEGVAGLPAVLGVHRSSCRAVCQIAGRALRVQVGVVDAEADRATEWFRVLLRYANFVTAMAAQTAACNRMHVVDARLCRWLLMTHDRVDGDEFPLTQEFLAMMLGVARPTVNIAGATLQRAGFIRYTRGRIRILDRRGLEAATCECYQRLREELRLTLQPDGARARAGQRRR